MSVASAPWFVEKHFGIRIVHGKPNADGFRDDVPGLGWVGNLGDARAEEIAERVVLSVNSHDELLALCRESLFKWHDEDELTGAQIPDDALTPEYREFKARLRAAVARAKGRQ